MTDRPPLLPRLRAADQALQREHLSPRATTRIRHRLARELARAQRPRGGWLPMLTFVAGAVLVLVVVALGRRNAEPPAVAAVEAPQPRPSGADCRWNDHDALALFGACEVALRSPPMRVRTHAGTQLTLGEHRARLDRGRALFDVDPLDRTFVVEVPGGTITIVGTRFEVEVTAAGGQVELYEGAILFEDTAGTATRMRPGDRVTFGLGAAARRAATGAAEAPAGRDAEARLEGEPPSSVGTGPSGGGAPGSGALEVHPPEPARPSRASRRGGRAPDPAPAPRVAAQLIDEVTRLRRARRYDEAAQALADALEQRWDRRTAEVLSFELGTILTRHLDEPARACRHWARHEARFPRGRYARAVAQARLGCEPTTRPRSSAARGARE